MSYRSSSLQVVSFVLSEQSNVRCRRGEDKRIQRPDSDANRPPLSAPPDPELDPRPKGKVQFELRDSLRRFVVQILLEGHAKIARQPRRARAEAMAAVHSIA